MTWLKVVGAAAESRNRVPLSCRPVYARKGFPVTGSPDPTEYARCVGRPRLAKVQVAVSGLAAESALSDQYRPPSQPAMTRAVAPTRTMATRCQSAWTYGRVPLLVSPPLTAGSQCETRVNVGAAALPFRVRRPHSIPPAT